MQRRGRVKKRKIRKEKQQSYLNYFHLGWRHIINYNHNNSYRHIKKEETKQNFIIPRF